MKVSFNAIAAGGDAVGHDEAGRVVFVPYAAPGDVAEVELTEEHRNYARGRSLYLESASPQRATPPCPYYLPTTAKALACGGCQLQHLDYPAQLAAKRGLVRDALRRIGGLDDATLDAVIQPCVASPQPFHYRNKADFVLTLQAGQAQIGFFAHGSHELIDVAHCLIQQPFNNALLTATRTCLDKGLAPPFEPQTGRGVLRRLVARTATNGECLLTAVTTRAAWPGAAEFAHAMRQAVPALVGVLRRQPQQAAQIINGRDWLEETVDTLTLRVTGEGFFQINTALTPTLAQMAVELAQPQAGQRILDLFCGVGLFGLNLARHGAQILGIEANRGATRDAQSNAQRNQIAPQSVRFIAGDAAAELRKLKAGAWDTALLDPPRAGAASVLSELARLRPARLVYVSCDPATLARDIKFLLAQGYRLDTVVPLDLFPQTAHVETIARLERR